MDAAAIAAGKHVLCEKPFTANAAEARQVADAAAAAGVVVTEAFHYRYHPLAERMRTIAHGGRARHHPRDPHRRCASRCPSSATSVTSYDLAGGAMMDAGCYALHCLRLLGTGDPEVVSATALLRSPKVDRAMSADFRFPDGARGHIETSMWSRRVLNMSAKVVGDRGTHARLQLRRAAVLQPALADDRRPDPARAGARRADLHAQLRGFAASVLRGEPSLTPAEDAVTTMRLIDDVYAAAGLPLRGAGS